MNLRIGSFPKSRKHRPAFRTLISVIYTVIDMTIVVGVVKDGAVYIGSDSQGSRAWEKSYRKDKKVFVSHGIAYGFTSSYRMGQILQYHSEEVLSSSRENDTHAYVVKSLIPMWRKVLADNGFARKRDSTDQGGTFLVGIDGRLFKIGDDFQAAEQEKPYDACGCGESYALGALFTMRESDPEEMINKSIAASMEFSNGCGGRIDIVSV